jgi:hypothetical protein
VDVVGFWTHFSVLCQLMNGSHKSRTLDFVQLMSQVLISQQQSLLPPHFGNNSSKTRKPVGPFIAASFQSLP